MSDQPNPEPDKTPEPLRQSPSSQEGERYTPPPEVPDSDQVRRLQQAHQGFERPADPSIHNATYAGPTVHQHYYATSGAPGPAGDPGFDVAVEMLDDEGTYVVHPRHAHAYQTLERSRTLLITGPYGSGRRMLARRLISRLCSVYGNLAVKQLTTASALLDCDSTMFATIPDRRCYLLIVDSPEQHAALSPRALDQLAGKVSQKSSYLIVVGPVSMALSHHLRWHVPIDREQGPAVAEVCVKHLVQHAERRADGSFLQQAQQLAQQQAVRQVLAQAPDLNAVVDMASELAKPLSEGATTAALVAICQTFPARWSRTYAVDRIQQVQHSAAHLCLMVAAAALDGVDISDFLKLADRLRQFMEQDTPWSETDRVSWNHLRFSPMLTWLPLTGARLQPLTTWQQNLQVTIEVIASDPPEASLHLIDAFWQQYLGYRGAFSAWLAELGADVETDSRARAAVASCAGLLLRIAPQQIDDWLIITWINSGELVAQQTAAMTIGYAAEKRPALLRETLRRLRTWNQNDQTRPRVIFASALIYAWMSITSPAEFVRGMDELVRGREAWVLLVRGNGGEAANAQIPAVRLAFHTALQLASFKAEDYRQLFDAMKEWVRLRGTQRSIAYDLFVDMQSMPALTAAPQSEDDEQQPIAWPLLLRIMADCSEVIPSAAFLFGYVARARRTRRASLEGINAALECAAADSAARPPLKAFCRELHRLAVGSNLAPTATSDPLLALSTQLREQSALHIFVDHLLHLARTADRAEKRSEPPPLPYSRKLLGWMSKQHLLPPDED